MENPAYPWSGPARAKRAAEYEMYGSESVDPTRSGRLRVRIIQKVRTRRSLRAV